MRRILLFLIVSFWLLILSYNSFAQDTNDQLWVKGYYYTLKGTKVSGLINAYKSNKGASADRYKYILFKVSESASEVEVSSDSIRAYVTLADSFVVSHDFILRKAPFLRVISDEPVKLYELKIMTEPNVGKGFYISKGYEETYYYYGRDPSKVTLLRKGHFLSQMTEIFGSVPALIDDIKYQNFTYNDMDQILIYYERYKQKSK